MLYNAPVDKKGPRFRKPVRNLLNIKFYNKLRKEIPGSPFSVMEIRKIITTFHEECINVLATNRDGLELPESLGFLLVGGYQTPTTGNYIGLPNWETNRKACRILYTTRPSKYKFKYSRIWGFSPGRQMKKAVSQSFIKNHTIFHSMGSTFRISKLFTKNPNTILERKLVRVNNAIKRKEQ